MSINELIEKAAHKQGQNPHQRAFQVQWEDHKFLVLSEDGGHLEEYIFPMAAPDQEACVGRLAVLVRKSNHRPFARYGFSAVCTILAGGRYVSSFRPRVDDQRLGLPKHDDTFQKAVVLMGLAAEWHQQAAAYQTDEYMRRQAAYASGPSKSEGPARREGKTERDRAKGKARPKTAA